ncbi:hypothetical protein WN944_006849 [Citrus x changshan-huyou]|uniref:Uncharacterized protein n=1 Tax=Citrus x changshan-huyou TaxID=2935761 RepID=A0AAP0MJW2_9ROSI
MLCLFNPGKVAATIPKRLPMARQNHGTKDGRPVDGKRIGRKILDEVQRPIVVDLKVNSFAYDGEKSLFTLGSFKRKKPEFTIVVEYLSSNRTARSDSPGGYGLMAALVRVIGKG